MWGVDNHPLTCCECEGPLRGGFCLFYNSRAANSFTYDPNPYSFNDNSNVFTHPLQPEYETNSCELCGNDFHYGYDCPPRLDGDDEDDDYDKESIIFTNTDIFETPSSDAITTSPPVLPIEDPEVSLIIGNEELNTISKKESNEFKKSSVEGLIPILSVRGYTRDDDESLSAEDVSEDNVKIYSNPLFEFDDEYISSDVNPLFNEVLTKPKPRSFSSFIRLLKKQVSKFRMIKKRVSKIKDAFENNQYKPEDIQELFRKFLDDLYNIYEELAEFINSPGWNRPAIYNDDDDDATSDTWDDTLAILKVLIG
nr:hypothetical protein [Tanacetum cinerariifolium]